MSPVTRPTDVRFFASAAELRDWFDANAGSADGLWLGHHRTSTGVPGPSVMEAIEEGLCVGWVDSTVYRIDDATYARRFTPRRPGSIWSARNVAIAERLIAEGRMRPAGLAAFEARTPERTAIYSYERAEAASPMQRPRDFGPTTLPGPTGSAVRRHTGGPSRSGSRAQSAPKRGPDGSRR